MISRPVSCKGTRLQYLTSCTCIKTNRVDLFPTSYTYKPTRSAACQACGIYRNTVERLNLL